jgi:hypothetical protein
LISPIFRKRAAFAWTCSWRKATPPQLMIGKFGRGHEIVRLCSSQLLVQAVVVAVVLLLRLDKPVVVQAEALVGLLAHLSPPFFYPSNFLFRLREAAQAAVAERQALHP